MQICSGSEGKIERKTISETLNKELAVFSRESKAGEEGKNIHCARNYNGNTMQTQTQTYTDEQRKRHTHTQSLNKQKEWRKIRRNKMEFTEEETYPFSLELEESERERENGGKPQNDICVFSKPHICHFIQKNKKRKHFFVLQFPRRCRLFLPLTFSALKNFYCCVGWLDGKAQKLFVCPMHNVCAGILLSFFSPVFISRHK